MRERMAPDARRDQLIKCGLMLAAKHGYMFVSRPMIAQELNVSEGIIPKYFGTSDNMRDELVKAALAECNIPVVAQAVAMRHDYVRGGLAPSTMDAIDQYMRSV